MSILARNSKTTHIPQEDRCDNTIDDLPLARCTDSSDGSTHDVVGCARLVVDTFDPYLY